MHIDKIKIEPKNSTQKMSDSRPENNTHISAKNKIQISKDCPNNSTDKFLVLYSHKEHMKSNRTIKKKN